MSDNEFMNFRRKPFCDDTELAKLTEEQMNLIANTELYANSPNTEYLEKRRIKRFQGLAS